MLTKPEPGETLRTVGRSVAPLRATVDVTEAGPRWARSASLDKATMGLLAEHDPPGAGAGASLDVATAVEVTELVLVGGPQLVRSMIASLLDAQPGILVAHGFDSVAELGEHCQSAALRCDVILVDVDDSPGECLETVDCLLAIGLRCKLVLLSSEATDEIVSCASSRRVDGVVLKESSAAELREALAHIRTGHAVMPARWHAVPDAAELTPRHRDVLELVAQGCTTEEIAARLGLRPNTVKFHISEIFRRLGARNRIEAITVLTGTSRPVVH